MIKMPHRWRHRCRDQHSASRLDRPRPMSPLTCRPISSSSWTVSSWGPLFEFRLSSARWISLPRASGVRRPVPDRSSVTSGQVFPPARRPSFAAWSPSCLELCRDHQLPWFLRMYRAGFRALASARHPHRQKESNSSVTLEDADSPSVPFGQCRHRRNLTYPAPVAG